MWSRFLFTAVELGLFEVFRHLVEEMNINLTKKIWRGFVLGGSRFCDSFRGTLADLAYRRGDTKTLQYLLSVPSVEAVTRRFTSYCGSAQRSSQCAQRVIALVEAGADPHARGLGDEDEDEDPYGYPPEDALALARRQVRYSNWPHIWKEIVDKMEHKGYRY